MVPEQIKQLVQDAANFTPERVIATAMHIEGLTHEEANRLFNVPGEPDMRVANVKFDILTHLEIIEDVGLTREFEKPARELIALLLIRDCRDIASYGSMVEITAQSPEQARIIERYLA